MADNAWGPDVAPHGLAEFTAPASAVTWTLQDSVVADQTFATAESASTDVYWGGLASMQFDATAGGADGTATPAGVSATSAIGTAIATGGALIVASGVAGVSVVGSAIATGAAQASPAGVSALSAIGSAVGHGDAITAQAGVGMVASVGTATAGVSGLATPAGVSVAASIGTVTATGDAIAAPSGVSALSAVGTATATGTALAAPLGVSATTAVGVALGLGDAVASPAGVSILASVGDVVASGEASVDATASPEGVEMVASVGQAMAFDADLVLPTGGVGSWTRHRDTEFVERVSVTVYPRGVSAQAFVGTATASGTATVSVAGVEAIAGVGTVVASGGAFAEPIGVSLTTEVGQPTAIELFVLPVLPYAPPRRDAVATPLGVLGRLSVGQASGVVADPPPVGIVVVRSVRHVGPSPDAIDYAWVDLQRTQADEDELLLLGVFDA